MSYIVGTRHLDRYNLGAVTAAQGTREASTVDKANIFQDKVLGSLQRANARLAALLVPLHPAIDAIQGPPPREWRERFKRYPIDALVELFAPIQGIAERVVRRAIELRRTPSIVIGIPGHNQIVADLRIDPPTVQIKDGRVISYPVMPESTARWLRRMRIINDFIILAFYDPVVFSLAIAQTFGRDMVWNVQAFVRQAQALGQMALSLLQRAGVPGAAQAAQQSAQQVASMLQQLAGGVADALPGQPPPPPGFTPPPTPKPPWPMSDWVVGAEPGTTAAVVGMGGSTTAGTTASGGAGATGAAAAGTTTATEVSPSVIETFMEIFQMANETGLTKEAMKTTASVIKETPGAVKDISGGLPGGGAAAETASQAEATQATGSNQAVAPGLSAGEWAAIGLGGAAVVGTVIWALTKK